MVVVVVLGSAAIFLNLFDYACKEQIQKQTIEKSVLADISHILFTKKLIFWTILLIGIHFFPASGASECSLALFF